MFPDFIVAVRVAETASPLRVPRTDLHSAAFAGPNVIATIAASAAVIDNSLIVAINHTAHQ
jgi:hypothetical protein